MRKLSRRFNWEKLEKIGSDKYEASVVISKFSRVIFRKYKEANISFPDDPIFISADAFLMGKIRYRK